MIASDSIAVSVEGSGQGRSRVAGTVCTIVVALFLALDTILKVLRLDAAVDATTAVGYPGRSVPWIGAIELVRLVCYLVPRTSVFAAVLMTGYLDGAVATHVRVSSPLLTHTLFPLYIGLLLWGGLYMRDPRVRALAPFAGSR